MTDERVLILGAAGLAARALFDALALKRFTADPRSTCLADELAWLGRAHTAHDMVRTRQHARRTTASATLQSSSRFASDDVRPWCVP